MKKIISLVIAAMMAVSMFAVTVPAMAANVSSPTAATLQEGKAQTTVNGETRQGVTYSVNAQTKKSVTFTYNGEGTFKSWTDNLSALGLAEGADYTKALNADGSQTITFISQKAITSWNNGSVVVNAVVEFADDTTQATEKDTTKATKATEPKKNSSSKSPATGASSAVMAGAIAAAGAGIAVLAATKKKEND